MNISVTSQNVHKHKKNIRRDDLDGLTCFMQMADSVRITASLEHQPIVTGFLVSLTAKNTINLHHTGDGKMSAL